MLFLGIIIFDLYIIAAVSSVYAPIKLNNKPSQHHQHHQGQSAAVSSYGTSRYGLFPAASSGANQSAALRLAAAPVASPFWSPIHHQNKNSSTAAARIKQQSRIEPTSRSNKRQNDLSNRSLWQSSSLLVGNGIGSETEIANYSLLANRSDLNPLSGDFLTPEVALGEAPAASSSAGDPVSREELNKIQMHTNNHQSAQVFNSNAGNTRLFNYHNTNNLNIISNNNNNKYNLNSNSFGTNINLNYIHSLLSSGASSSKPPSSHIHKGPLTSLLSSNSYGLALPSSYSSNNYYSLASSLPSYNSIRDSNNNINKRPGKQSQILFEQEDSQPSGNASSSGAEDTFGPSLQHCGRQQVGYREPRIVGGNNTFEGEFPWAVSIQRHGNHHCGGVIVGKRWILTAAHCVRSQLVGNLLVRTGGHTLTRNSNSINSDLERDYFVEQIVMHGDFSRYDNLTASQMKSSANTNNADIALLRLRNDITWNEFAWPVCFPHRESGNFSGHDAIVIGWGKLNEKSEDFSNELQKVKLTIIDNKVCQNWFRQAGREMPIDDRIICAGFKNGGKDACHGDSGGPLLSKINGHYVVVGVVSTGIGCARPLLPGLYSRVSSYIGWIERHVTSN